MNKISRISYQIVLAIILALECAFAYATIVAFASSQSAEDKWVMPLFLLLWTAFSCFFWLFGDMFFKNSDNPVEFQSLKKQLSYWKQETEHDLLDGGNFAIRRLDLAQAKPNFRSFLLCNSGNPLRVTVAARASRTGKARLQRVELIRFSFTLRR